MIKEIEILLKIVKINSPDPVFPSLSNELGYLFLEEIKFIFLELLQLHITFFYPHHFPSFPSNVEYFPHHFLNIFLNIF